MGVAGAMLLLGIRSKCGEKDTRSPIKNFAEGINLATADAVGDQGRRIAVAPRLGHIGFT